MSQYLRAFLFDPSQTSGQLLVQNVFSSWEQNCALAIIPAMHPKVQIDSAIVRCDPNEVVDLSTKEVKKRTLAIVDSHDLAAVVLTSGTTSDPLPVELGFESMKSSVESLYRKCNLSKKDSWLCCVPPYYIAGLAIFARCFVSGSHLIFHERFDVERIRNTIVNESPTAISLVATQLRRLLKSDVDLSSFKTILVGGGPLNDELKKRCDDLNLKIKTSYGMTETWGGICIDGDFLDNTKGRIADNQLELSTSSLMLGYRHNFPETIAHLTPDHWLKTRDRAKIKNGKLKILGRADDVINSGGIKIDPIALEDSIKSLYPNFEFYLTATEHPDFGQATTVCFLSKDKHRPTLGELRTELLEHLPSTHMPTRLAIVDEFPKTDSGKIQRTNLAQQCSIVEDFGKICD